MLNLGYQLVRSSHFSSCTAYPLPQQCPSSRTPTPPNTSPYFSSCTLATLIISCLCILSLATRLWKVQHFKEIKRWKEHNYKLFYWTSIWFFAHKNHTKILYTQLQKKIYTLFFDWYSKCKARETPNQGLGESQSWSSNGHFQNPCLGSYPLHFEYSPKNKAYTFFWSWV